MSSVVWAVLFAFGLSAAGIAYAKASDTSGWAMVWFIVICLLVSLGVVLAMTPERGAP